jgi:hypothetical protein
MISNRCSSYIASILAGVFLLCSAVRAQDQPSPPQPAAQASTPVPSSLPVSTQQHVTPQQKPPRPEPAVIEDGGWSFEPEYWLNRAQPTLVGGALASGLSTLDYFGHANPSLAGELSMPAGKQNTLRLSYFRVQGNTNETAPQDATLFGENYNAGDFLTANYLIQAARLSWDYLSYTWYKPKTKIRLKTLWEVQFANISTNIDAPLKPQTTDANGNTDYNTASGSAKIIYPTFGLEFEQPVTRHFRWWVRGSGFGIPHHGDIWDAEASIALRLGQFEIIGGERAYHFKTSPQSSQYFIDTLSGAYVGLRWYWTHGSM